MHQGYPSHVISMIINMFKVANVVFATPGDSSMAIWFFDHRVSPWWKLCWGDWE